MNQNRLTNFGLIAVACILAGVVGYVVVTQKICEVVPLPAPATQSPTVAYRNTEYGFTFSLPATWRGYTTVTDSWEGLSIGGPQGEQVIEQGPQISLRHPQWTTTVPRQDIPIMVVTLPQWQALQQEKFHIGAAPIGPRELGRNLNYVFALPARYNFAYPLGFEEVETILQSKPLQAF